MTYNAPNLIASNPQSFIIKVWVEDSLDDVGGKTWRGHITHVPSGERRYFDRLDEVLSFITPHLEALGVVIDKRRRLLNWLKRWRSGRSSGRRNE
jgi:hypothetical protein